MQWWPGRGARGAMAPQRTFLKKFKKGAKNFMKCDGSLCVFQQHVAGHTGYPHRCI